MPAFCAVINCGNRSDRERKSFFRVPNLPNRACEGRRNLIALRRHKWLDALKRADITEKKVPSLRICGDHFISGKPADLRNLNNPDWVPSLNMGYEKRGACLYQSYPKKNVNCSNGKRRKGFWRKKLLMDGEINTNISKGTSSQSEVGTLMEKSLMELTSFQREKFSTENTCALDASVFECIFPKSNRASEIYENTLNKENNNVNLMVEQNLSSVKEQFTYKNLVNNVALIKKPNEFWAINSLSDVVICARWTEDYACEKKVVIENLLTVRVYLKGWEINLSELLNITCLDDISNLLRKVESYKMVKLQDLE